jgi:hypothetical protein
MSGEMVEPLAFPTARHAPHPGEAKARAGRGRPPLADLPPQREGGWVYGLASMDARGRLADQQVLHALGWGPGERLDIRTRHDMLIVHAHPDGVFSITNQGHLRLPAPVRRWIGLTTGERVFLAADQSARRLIVHSPAALDRMVTQSHAHLSEHGPDER